MDRLVRALAQGGCTAQTSAGDWAVWRNRDRRGRAIGLLSAEAIERLEIAGRLKPLGTFEDGRLAWSGPRPELKTGPCSPEALLRDDRSRFRPRTLAQRLLERCREPRRRQRLRGVMRDYGEDVERALTRAGAGGMNWQAIRAGTAIQGGRNRPGGMPRRAYVYDAVRRLEQIEKALGPRKIRLLDRIIIDGDSRTAIADWLVLKPKPCERYCLDVLGQLADAYDLLTRRPGRAGPPPV